MAAPSLPIFAAYIQLTLALMSSILVAEAKHRLVSASPIDRRAMAAGLRRPLSGCSPMLVASPVVYLKGGRGQQQQQAGSWPQQASKAESIGGLRHRLV